jgi:hypothetical protein
MASSQIIAGVDVSQGDDKEAQPKGKHQQICHSSTLLAKLAPRKRRIAANRKRESAKEGLRFAI